MVNGGLVLIISKFDGLAVGGVDPFPGFIAGGAVIEPAGHGTVEFRGAVDCHIVTVPEKFGIPTLRQGKALDPEEQIGAVTIHNGLHRRNSNALIGGAEHLAGGYLLLLVLQHHGQAAFLCLLLDLLGRVVGRLGASRPAGEHRRAGECANDQRGRQSQQQKLFPAPALTRGFGGHEKRHHALLIVSGKVNGIHGTPQFRFYIVGHTTWLLSSVSSARSFRRPRDRYWVMLASDLPITWAISFAEYSS